MCFLNGLHTKGNSSAIQVRQVTASMRQDGENQVAIIRSQAEKEAAQRLGRAQAERPRIVGETLSKIRANPEVAEALFRLLDLQATLRSPGKITLLPSNNGQNLQIILPTQ